MKKILRMMLAIVLLFTPFCRANASQEDTFRVGMEVNYAPYNFSEVDDKNGGYPVANSKGEFANGYDVQFAKKIADGLGKKLEIYKIEWDGLIPALTSGKIDAIIAGMSPTEERLQQIDFSVPYYHASMVVVTQKNSKYVKAKSINDFAGAKITAQLGTFHLAMIDQMKGVNKQEPMDSFPTMIAAANAGTIDGYISEEAGAQSAIASNPKLTYIKFEDGKGFETKDEDTTVGVGIAKNSPLTAQVNKILSSMDIPKEQEEIMDKMTKLTANEKESTGFISEVKSIWSTYSGLFLKGVVNTMFIAVVSTILGFLIGLVVAVIRRLEVKKTDNIISYYFHKIINAILAAYVEIFRGTPMMVQSVIIFYGLKQYFDIDLSTIFAAVLIVSINTGAYLSEVVRGGINSINKGQFEACKAIGMTHFQTMIHVILPQTILTILPSLGNEFVINIKDTSVLNVISVTELFFMSKSVAGSTYQYFPTYLITAVIYFVLTFTITRILLVLEKRFNDTDFIMESSTGAKNV
ncbi:ABC transporter substrate-binding protein/permease [Anaerococcus tetradius]|uniref:ABC transporter substrate-binding protein/permease n=1 Tax=Anaerococcus tetradius TaxID=33036 RepID=UPI0023EFBA26|nr:ABC transporter substrate-binding protein/permease [Anaerococcus tetradius]